MWLPLPRLYRLRPRTALRDELIDMGAGDKPGIFDPHPSTPLGAIGAVIASHQVAIAHPAPAWALPLLWWPLRRAGNAASDPFVGPPLYVDDTGFALPAPAADGLSIAAALHQCLLAVPAAMTQIPGRAHKPSASLLGEALLQLLEAGPVLELAAFRQVTPFARRVLPPLRSTDTAALGAWLAQQRALPSGPALRRWHDGMLAEHWYRQVVARFLAQLVAGELVAQVDGDRVPPEWWRAPMTLDLDSGALITLYGVELHRGLQVYRRADAPRPNVAATSPGKGRRATVRRRLAANRSWGWGTLGPPRRRKARAAASAGSR